LDFALILVIATGITGVIWLADAILLRKSREARLASGGVANEPLIVEYARSFFPVLLLVLLLRSFLFEPFRIPSGSMMPTLLTGDFIFVNKFAYGLRLPVINTKIVEIGEPERGDVVVFRLPREPSVNYIKRIVGLPGDSVFYDEERKQVTVNGVSMDIERIGTYTEDDSYDLAREVLGEQEHDVLWIPGKYSMGGTFEVPPGYYFMMGDNRDNSEDSRFANVGYVPEANLVGRASRVWLSWSGFGEGVIRWARIGRGID
jgi:signal peptidase I